MENILLSPLVAFIILLVISLLFLNGSKLIAAKGGTGAGKEEAYACGEDIQTHKVQPDYRQFFPFAFFFTIMHVIALIVATIPGHISVLAILYLFVAVIALFILFRK